MKEGWTSLHKTIREINLVFKGLMTACLQAFFNFHTNETKAKQVNFLFLIQQNWPGNQLFFFLRLTTPQKMVMDKPACSAYLQIVEVPSVEA